MSFIDVIHKESGVEISQFVDSVIKKYTFRNQLHKIASEKRCISDKQLKFIFLSAQLSSMQKGQGSNQTWSKPIIAVRTNYLICLRNVITI